MSKNIGKVIALYISSKDQKKRINKESLLFDKGGIPEDKFHNIDNERSVLITSTHSYALVKQHHIALNFGLLGENLLVDYNLYHLSHGSRLQIGTTILEISQNCTICNHLSNIDERLPELLKNDRGIFAKVIEDGEIKKEDTITLLTLE